MKKSGLLALLLCLAIVLAGSTVLAVDDQPTKEPAAQQAAGPGPVVPTLGEWGLIIFSGLLVGYMAYTVVRRRRGADISA